MLADPLSSYVSGSTIAVTGGKALGDAQQYAFPGYVCDSGQRKGRAV